MNPQMLRLMGSAGEDAGWHRAFQAKPTGFPLKETRGFLGRCKRELLPDRWVPYNGEGFLPHETEIL